MDIESLKIQVNQFITSTIEWASSPQFYSQFGLILLSLILAYSFSSALKKYSPLLRESPTDGRWLPFKNLIFQLGELLFPLFIIMLLGIAVELSNFLVHQSWLVRISQSLAVVFLIYAIITSFVKSPFIKIIFKWVIIPVAVLQVFGWMHDVVTYLDTIYIEIGNIRISAYGMARVLVFGTILFWLGRISNSFGQQIIRKQEGIDIGTREVFAKLFQVGLFMLIFFLLLQVMGINLTTIAVFGGALGVGLGFGLQAIASNFISGMIILLDRSLKVGDYIELDDGSSGTIRELNMRSALLETFDGKDVMVPNEQFITTRFINWTHKNKKQRYSLEFQVAYKTDLPVMLDIVKEVVRAHPQVINEPDTPIEELADAEIAGFGDSGVDILVEFWMDGVDDGKNRVGADLLMLIWLAFKEHNIEIPFPQREVKLLNQEKLSSKSI